MSHSETEVLQIVVNGESQSVPKGATVLSLLSVLGITPDRVAVELNRNIVRQQLWAETPLEAGAQVEIVQFVGGG
jgi:thiamine biosynthesis protein ThiS